MNKDIKAGDEIEVTKSFKPRFSNTYLSKGRICKMTDRTDADGLRIIEGKGGYHYIVREDDESCLQKISGGKIKNQYEGKAAKQVWDEWTTEQREHFLTDHKINPVSDEEELKHWAEKEYKHLTSDITDKLSKHVGEGSYSKGGPAKGIKGHYVLKIKPRFEDEFLAVAEKHNLDYNGVGEDNDGGDIVQEYRINVTSKEEYDDLKKIPNNSFEKLSDELEEYAKGGPIGHIHKSKIFKEVPFWLPDTVEHNGKRLKLNHFTGCYCPMDSSSSLAAEEK